MAVTNFEEMPAIVGVHNEDPEMVASKDVPQALGDYSGAVEKSDPIEIALVRKLDMRIMPTLWAMYFMNYLDRSAIANARLNGLEKDLGLVGTQYVQPSFIKTPLIHCQVQHFAFRFYLLGKRTKFLNVSFSRC